MGVASGRLWLDHHQAGFSDLGLEDDSPLSGVPGCVGSIDGLALAKASSSSPDSDAEVVLRSV